MIETVIITTLVTLVVSYSLDKFTLSVRVVTIFVVVALALIILPRCHRWVRRVVPRYVDLGVKASLWPLRKALRLDEFADIVGDVKATLDSVDKEQRRLRKRITTLERAVADPDASLRGRDESDGGGSTP